MRRRLRAGSRGSPGPARSGSGEGGLRATLVPHLRIPGSALPFDAQRPASPVKVGMAVPPGGGEVGDGAAADARCDQGPVDGFMAGRVAEADRLEVFEDAPPVVLDGGRHAVSATPGQAARGLVPGMHGIGDDDAPGEAGTAGDKAAPGRRARERPRKIQGRNFNAATATPTMPIMNIHIR